MDDDKELMPVQEFMYRFSISRTAFYREVKAKRLRLTKRGRRSMILRTDAVAWLQNLDKKENENAIR